MTDEPTIKDLTDELRAKHLPVAPDAVTKAREAAWKTRCAADLARSLAMRNGSDQHTAEDIATRASDISDHLWKQAVSRGWTY